MGFLSEAKVLGACQVLFGEGVRLDRDFLFYLQPSGAKAAYRRRAKEVHPDLLERGAPEIRRHGAELFRQLVEAHDLMTEFFRQRESGLWQVTAAARYGKPSARTRSHASGPGHAARSADRVRYYQGSVPEIHLNIGRYCYYRGMVPYPVLIEAVAWQRRQRPPIGEIARRWGWLTEETLHHVASCRGIPGRFGERAVQLGVLAPAQVQSLLYFQRTQQQRLGQYFVEKGYLSGTDMDRLVRELQVHNARVGAAARR